MGRTTQCALSLNRLAGVAELVDAPGLGPGGLAPLEVRVLSPASIPANRPAQA